MGEQGWEFCQAYAASFGNQNVYHWLMKHKISEEEKKNYIPIIKRNLEEK